MLHGVYAVSYFRSAAVMTGKEIDSFSEDSIAFLFFEIDGLLNLKYQQQKVIIDVKV